MRRQLLLVLQIFANLDTDWKDIVLFITSSFATESRLEKSRGYSGWQECLVNTLCDEVSKVDFELEL